MVLSGNRIDNPWSAAGQAGSAPNGTDYFYAGVATSPTGPRDFIRYDYYPDMPCTAAASWPKFRLRTSDFSPLVQAPVDIWTCLEMEVLLNTPGEHDGLHRAWVNGVLTVEKLNIRWRDSTFLNLNAFQLSFSGNPGVDTHMWVDNVVVSTQRVGCLWMPLRLPHRQDSRRDESDGFVDQPLGLVVRRSFNAPFYSDGVRR